MDVAPVRHGLRVTAFDGARPLLLLAEGAEARIAHTWHHNFDLARERERGLDAVDDHLHAGTFRAALESRSEEHTSELQSQSNLVCRLLLEKKKKQEKHDNIH